MSRLKNQNIKEIYVPTLGVETSKLYYKGRNFNIWDTSGNERFAGLKEGYYIGSDFAIIMISNTVSSYQSITQFKNMIIRTCGNIPIVIAINKCDLNNTENNYNKLKCIYENVILISCKENISIHEPLDKLLSLQN